MYMAGPRTSSGPIDIAWRRYGACGNFWRVKDLRRETTALKEMVADFSEKRTLKSVNGDGENEA